MMKRRTLLKVAMAVTVAAMSNVAPAQPASSIRMLVGYPAGGAPDAVARAFAEHLRQNTGATVIVENRPGASGKLAIDALLTTPANGLTVAVMPSSTLLLVPMVVKSATYDVAKDFTALGNLAEYGFGFAAGPASGAADLAAFKTWVKANPTQVNYATPGTGTPQHFLGAQLQKALNTEMMHVPYKGGAAAMGDLLGGQVPFLITTEQLLVPSYKEGKLKTLFVTSPVRNPKMPTVPTAKEAGLPQLEVQDWFGLFVKSGTPTTQVEDWRAKIGKVTSSAGYQQAIANMGYTIPAKQLDNYAPQLETERKAWAERVKISGFKATD